MTSLMAQMVKNLHAMWETWVWSLDWEDPLEKGTATHSSILAWRIPRTGKPGRLQSMGSQRVGHDWATFTTVTKTVGLGVALRWLFDFYISQGLKRVHNRKDKLTVQTMNILKEIHAHTNKYAAAAAKSLQSCPTLCDPIDGSPPGSTIPGILQARTLEWVAISFSNAWRWKVKVKSLSRVPPSATPWTAAYQAPPSMGVPRQEYWSGLPVPSLHK